MYFKIKTIRTATIARVVAVPLVVGIAGAALLSTSKPQRLARHRAHLALSAAPRISPQIAAELSVFSRPANGTDALPPAESAALAQEFSSESPDASNARTVTASNGLAVHLVPATTGLCVINTNEQFCTPTAQHLPGAAAVDLCSPTLPAGQLELEWLLPDGATNVRLGMSDQTAQAFGSGYNVYIVRLPFSTSSATPTTIQWQDRAGQAHSVPTPIPSWAIGQSCATAGSNLPTVPSASATNG